MDETTTVQGREITKDDIELVRRLIRANPSWNRTRLSQELCLLWNWRAANGQIKDMACRSLLLKLEQRGPISPCLGVALPNFPTNNMRFLILPWVRVPHLASHILGRVARRISSGWIEKYGHPVYLLSNLCRTRTFSGPMLPGSQLDPCRAD